MLIIHISLQTLRCLATFIYVSRARLIKICDRVYTVINTDCHNASR